MPLIYRQRSFSFSSDTENDLENIPPAPTDADDSIVLSDLVRTGEASRLRRRGAMRLDHTLSAQTNPQNQSSPTVIVVGSPTWESEIEEREPTGPVFARRADRDRYARSRGQPREPRRASEEDSEDYSYTLFCGGESDEHHEVGGPEYASYQPSILPLHPVRPPRPAAPNKRRKKSTNGCGAVLHMRAAPRSRLNVWTAKSEASGAVVPMDPSYFDRTAVAKIVRSACGCVREGVGCVACGNPLGTRYKPCKTAGDGIFCARPKPSGPLHPEGPRYWHANAYSSSPHPSSPNFYVFTFFSSAVSSSPAYTFPSRPTTSHGHAQPVTQAQLSMMYNIPTRAQSPPFQFPLTPTQQPGNDTDNDSPSYSNTMFDRYMTASPTPLSDVGEEDRETYTYTYPYPYPSRNTFLGVSTPRAPPPPMGTGTAQQQSRQDTFDPDGEYIDEPSSPDKTGEVMLFPER